MANVSSQHLSPLTMGFVGVLVFAILGIGIVNHLANKRG